MAEKQIPAISQVGGKVGIGLKKPEHPLQVSGTIHISADVNDDLLSWHGGGLRRESEQGGFVLGSDSSVMLHAGDNRVSVWGYDSLNDSSTGEILHLTSDNMVEIHTGLQTGGSSKWDVNRWRFLNSGSTEFPTSASVYNNGFVSGFIGGTGWQIRKTGDMTFAEFDNILVRNTLQTHIFQKDVVKATNGQLYVSDSGVIVATNGSSTVTFNSQSATFTDNTLLQYKDVNPDTGIVRDVPIPPSIPTTMDPTKEKKGGLLGLGWFGLGGRRLTHSAFINKMLRVRSKSKRNKAIRKYLKGGKKKTKKRRGSKKRRTKRRRR